MLLLQTYCDVLASAVQHTGGVQPAMHVCQHVLAQSNPCIVLEYAYLENRAYCYRAWEVSLANAVQQELPQMTRASPTAGRQAR